MPLFALMCLDKPDALDLRMATRERHLAYVRDNAGKVRLAGPLFDDTEQMAGSFFVLDVADKAAAEAFNAADPYTQAGVFGTITIRHFKATFGQPI
ncbi:YciI family protein [Phenylobacterium sp. VNQ135]|uniref:YciI family protein n=1 Tax=Phenylobacterium sp. VNQ135 TaxID=3400922 RepID=UPI003C04E9E5